MESVKDMSGPVSNKESGVLSFLKGSIELLTGKDGKSLAWDESVSRASKQLSEAFSARHVAFLLGSGASSLERDGQQLGIPTMAYLAKEFSKCIGTRGDKKFLTNSERQALSVEHDREPSVQPVTAVISSKAPRVDND